MKDFWIKIKKFLTLLVKNVEVQIFLYISVLLFAISYTSFATEATDLIINLFVSFISTFILLFINTITKFIRFIKLEGTYDAILYKSNNKQRLDEDRIIGEYLLQYEGGYIISLKKVKCLEQGWEDHLWEGEAEISDTNIGTLYWQQTSPEESKNLTGYKKIIIPRSKGNRIMIYLFDESILFGHREVLIKQSNE